MVCGFVVAWTPWPAVRGGPRRRSRVRGCVWTAAEELRRERRADEVRDLVNAQRDVDGPAFGDVRLHMLVLQAFAEQGNLDQALNHFGDMKTRGVRPDSAVYNYLMGCLARRRRLRQLFELKREMELYHVPLDGFTYAAIIQAYATVGNERMCWRFYDEMCRAHIQPTEGVFGNLASAAARLGNPERARLAMRHMRSHRMAPNCVTYNALISACARAGDVRAAVEAFAEMQRERVRPDHITFTSLMAAYAAVGDLDGVKSTYEEFRLRGRKPDVIMMFQLLRAQAITGDVRGAEECLEEMERLGVEPDRGVFAAMIDLYGRAGRLAKATAMFEQMLTADLKPNTVTFNVFIDAHIRNGDPAGAIDAFARMQSTGVRPNAWTFTTLIHAHTSHNDLTGAENALQSMLDYGIQPGSVTYTTLIDGFSQARNLAAARRYYARIKRDTSCKLNARVYNAMMRANVVADQPRTALRQFRDMVRRGVEPDQYTFALLVEAHSRLDDLPAAERVVRRTAKLRGTASSGVAELALLRAYAERGSRATAEQLLRRVPPQPGPRSDAHAVLVELYLQRAEWDRALAHCERLWAEGVRCPRLQELCLRALLGAGHSARCLTRLAEAAADGVRPTDAAFVLLARKAAVPVLRAADALEARGLWGAAACGQGLRACAMLGDWAGLEALEERRRRAGLRRTGAAHEALLVRHAARMDWSAFHTARRAMHADGHRLTRSGLDRALEGLAALGLDDAALAVFRQYRRCRCNPGLRAFNAVLRVHGARGEPDAAGRVLTAMLAARFVPDAASFNAYLCACLMGAQPNRALAQLPAMEERGVRPDAVTYNTLLRACLDCGEHARAAALFVRMRRCGLTPDRGSLRLLKSACAHLDMDAVRDDVDSLARDRDAVPRSPLVQALLVDAPDNFDEQLELLRTSVLDVIASRRPGEVAP